MVTKDGVTLEDGEMLNGAQCGWSFWPEEGYIETEKDHIQLLSVRRKQRVWFRVIAERMAVDQLWITVMYRTNNTRIAIALEKINKCLCGFTVV